MSEPAMVVGAALLHKGRLLAARRAMPPIGWELPGGKVEPREHDDAAVVREIHEELGCTVSVTGWLPGESEVRPGLVLRVALVRLESGEPVPAEHDIVWWLRSDQLEEVEWLPPDRPFLVGLAELLRASDAGSGGHARGLAP
ncbi:MAG: NUDIX domain-containing protein [Marmoricola sp.]